MRDVYARVASLTLMTVAYDLVAQEENAGGTDEDTLASLLVSAILEWVLQGFVAKNKIVCYQAVHLVAEMIPFLGEVECVLLSNCVYFSSN
jgi:hypothetical protein